MIDLSSIPFADIPNNSLLIVRLRPGESQEDVVASYRAQLHESVRVLILQPDTEVTCVEEAVLNEAGWVRR